MEDGGATAAGAAGAVPTSRGRVTVDASTAAFGLGTLTLDNGSYTMPDIVANVRVDQKWGSAALKGALHQNKGGYYAGGIGCPPGNANNVNCGHPDDKIGWAVGAGVTWNIPGLPGDSLAFEANFAQGATGYITRSNQSWRIWGAGRSIGIGWASDSVFSNGSGLELTQAWNVSGAYEHRWNPQWRTSVYGGYVAINYNDTASAQICAAPPAGVTFANCSPDFSWWAAGSRTQWNPHPYLDVGLDLQYMRLNTAFAGTGTTTVADGARPAGAIAVEDQNIYAAFFRVQYNLLP